MKRLLFILFVAFCMYIPALLGLNASTTDFGHGGSGSGAGINEGDEFDVYRKGEELIDPETGLSLGAEEEKVGTIRVTEVKDKYSIAEIIQGSIQAKDYLK